jgi:hypothetical protein
VRACRESGLTFAFRHKIRNSAAELKYGRIVTLHPSNGKNRRCRGPGGSVAQVDRASAF